MQSLWSPDSHSRSRFRTPLPQLTLHSSHGAQLRHSGHADASHSRQPRSGSRAHGHAAPSGQLHRRRRETIPGPQLREQSPHLSQRSHPHILHGSCSHSDTWRSPPASQRSSEAASHCRCLSRSPSPQLTSQLVQDRHGPQPPHATVSQCLNVSEDPEHSPSPHSQLRSARATPAVPGPYHHSVLKGSRSNLRMSRRSLPNCSTPPTRTPARTDPPRTDQPPSSGRYRNRDRQADFAIGFLARSSRCTPPTDPNSPRLGTP